MRIKRAVATVLAVTTTVLTASTNPAAAQSTGTVQVHPTKALARIEPGAVGADVPFWNPHLKDARTTQLIRGAGIGTLDFDAGAPLDLYDWRHNQLRPDPDAARDAPFFGDWTGLRPTFTFDEFEATARRAGVRTTVHVNYGTGTAAEAAAWVNYANNVRHDRVQNWMIGAEVWLDQIFEPNNRVSTTSPEPPELDGTRYAKDVIAFAAAMKAVDPTIRIGVELATVVAGQENADDQAKYFTAWNRAVVATPGLTSAIDYVDIHGLPRHPDEDPTITGALAAVRTVPATLAAMRADLDHHQGHQVTITVGEVNSFPAGNEYTTTTGNAAYLADAQATLLEHGVTSAHWFALYSGLNQPAPGADLGLISSGSCLPANSGQVCESAAGTPFATYYAEKLFGSVAVPTGTWIATATATAGVSTHAVRLPNATVKVLLINTSGATTQPETISVDGACPTTEVRVSQTSASGITTWSQAGNTSIVLPPYSVTVATYRSAGAL
ncbi:hypothetical protein GCM10009765_15520 [Fodinicola feengrottensis]|uniref:Uncharacterized protein n=1 Tax=Fodinicola feengrottensis TaxID=435914 RepID=A0ABP4S6V3_9ACTN